MNIVILKWGRSRMVLFIPARKKSNTSYGPKSCCCDAPSSWSGRRRIRREWPRLGLRPPPCGWWAARWAKRSASATAPAPWTTTYRGWLCRRRRRRQLLAPSCWATGASDCSASRWASEGKRSFSTCFRRRYRWMYPPAPPFRPNWRCLATAVSTLSKPPKFHIVNISNKHFNS